MKIKRIEIHNFRSIEHLILDGIDGGLMLLGPNGAGKSSVIEAVRYALFGHAAWTTSDGKGGGQIVREGAKEAGVMVDTDVGRVVFSVTAAGKRDWTLVDADGQVIGEEPSVFWHLAGVDKRHAEISANLGFSIDTGEFADVLGAHLAGTITRASVLGAAGEHCAWLEQFLKDIAPPQTVQAWRNVGELAFKARTGLNGELKQVKQFIADSGFLALPKDKQGREIPVERIPDVQTAQSDLSSKRDQLNRELGAATAARPAVDRNAVQEKLDKKTVEHETAVAESKAAQEKAQGTYDQMEEVSARMNEQGAAVRTIDAELARLKQNRDTMMGGICPLCNQAIPPELVKAAEQDIAEAEQRRATVDGERKSLCESVESLRARYNEYKSSWTQQQAAADRLKHEVATLNAQLAEVAAPQGQPAAEIQAEIDAVAASLARGEDIMKTLTAIRDLEGQKQRQAELEALVAHHSWAVTAFRDGEVLSRLVSGNKRDELVAACNAQFDGTGYALDIVLNGKQVDVLFNGRKLALCSTGEQRLAQWAFANAFAGGAAPVILDDINDLDGTHKELVRQRPGGIYAATWPYATTPDETQLAAMQQAFNPARVAWMGR